MNYLIDSDVIIDFQNLKEPGASYFINATKEKSFISVISYSEIVFGIKSHPGFSEKIRVFDNLLKDLEIEILGVNKKEILEFTDLKLDLKKVSNLIPDFDLIIAASAIANNLALVTRNTKHFFRVPHLKLFSQKSS